MATRIDIDKQYTRTYKTEENLEKAIVKLNLPKGIRYIVHTIEDRYTAIFFINANDGEQGMYLAPLARHGFKVIA